MDRRVFLWSTAAMAATAARSGRAPVQARPADRPWIPPDELMSDLPRLMTLASVPGLSIAVVEDGAVAWTRAIGVLNADTGAPVTTDTVFPAASLGKPVFGYVVMKLVDEGRLDLHRPLVDYFRPEGLPPASEPITAAHVLSHTTGLRNWRNRVDQPLAPDFAPGARFQYSGEGFFWLGQAVEAVTGQGIERVMRERLFQPAGMTRATYGWTRNHERWTTSGHTSRGAVGNHFSRTLGAKLLAIAEETGTPLAEWTAATLFRQVARADPSLPLVPNFVIPNVAGSLLCTAPEYAGFLGLLQTRTRRDSWEIAEASRLAMLTPRVDLKPSLSWGLGWGLERRSDGPLFWHWGDNGIFKAFCVGDPARRRGIVVFTNGDGGPKVYQRIIRAATGFDLDAFVWV